MDDTQPWAFNHLNQLSPPTGPSPTNGTSSSQNRNDLSLSYPINSEALQRQLEAWTNIEFDFDQPVDFGLLPLEEYKGSEEIGLGGGLYGNGQTGYGMTSNGRDTLHDYGLGSIGLGLESTERNTGMGDTTQLDSSLANFGLPLVLPTLLPSSSSSSTSFPTIPNFDLPVSLPLSTNSTTPKVSNPKKRKQSVSASASTSTGPSEEGEEFDSFPPLVLGLDEEANAIAVEEDKRRRNTAASARFRIKKKQREAALESTTKELRDKVTALETENESLRTENGWLRGLIVEKAQKEEMEKKIKLEAEANALVNGTVV